MKKVLASVLIGLAFSSSYAVDFTLRTTPSVGIPLGENFTPGFTGFVQADADMFGFLTAGVEGNVSISSIDVLKESAYFYGAGAGLGAYYYPLSRLYLGAGGAFGVYQMTTSINDESQTTSDMYWRGYGELGFRFTPEFTLSATGGYMSYMTSDDSPILNNITAGLGIRYTIPLGKKGSSSVITSISQSDSAFPLYMRAYRFCPLGSLTLRNNEGAEIKNVHVSFRAGRYTASTFESAAIPRINKYGSVVVDLYSDFSAEILRFTENGKISGEIVVDYEFLGKKYQSVQNAVISVYNRNAFSWIDSAALSAFISPETPEVLELAKYIAGIARNNFYTGMNRNIQMAAAMMEGLRLGGITYSGDKLTPYLEYYGTDKTDYIQYPLQTMNYLGGDYDDMGILLASCLESVGVPTGYITMDNDFIVLVSTGTKPGSEESLFANADDVFADDENVYFGLSMVYFEKGFTKSRAEAAKKIRSALAGENMSAEFTSVHSAWEVYSPAVFSENGSYFEKPGSAEITNSTTSAIKDYMNTDLAEVLARARKSNDPNKIGVALVKMGRYSEAKAEFSKQDTTKSLNNLANVYMIEKNYSQAASTYKRVLAKDPENRIALKGLDNANAKLGL